MTLSLCVQMFKERLHRFHVMIGFLNMFSSSHDESNQMAFDESRKHSNVYAQCPVAVSRGCGRTCARGSSLAAGSVSTLWELHLDPNFNEMFT